MDLLTWLRAQWDRIAGFGCVAAGGVLLVLGWVGASAATRSADEISYLISGGLAGLFLLGIGATLLISADMHDEWRKLDRIEAAILSGEGSSGAGERATADEVVLADGSGSGALAGGVPAGTPAPFPERAGMTSAVALVRRGDAGTLGLAAVSAVLLGFGWVRASGETGPEPSLGGAYLATAGLLFLAVAATGFMLTCRMRCRDRKVRLLAPYAARVMAAGPRDAPGGLPADQVVVAEGVALFHRPGCPILAGLAAQPVTRSAVTDGLKGCGICGADRGPGGVPRDYRGSVVPRD